MATTRTLARAALAFAGAACLLLPTAGPAQAGPPSNWYQDGAYGGHAGANDVETALTASTAPSVHAAWLRALGSPAPLVLGPRVWTVGYDDVLRSFAVGTGRQQTSTRVGACTGGGAPAAATPDVVVVSTTGCGHGNGLRAFSTRDGHPVWHLDVPRTVSALALKAGVLYVAGARGSLRAVDVADGHVRWSREGGQELTDVVVSGSGRGLTVYTAAFQAVQAWSPVDGHQLWRRQTGESVPSIAAVGGRVYVGDVAQADAAGDQTVTCLSSTGATLWTRFVGEGVSSSDPRPAVTGDSVVVATTEGTVVELDAGTGARRWTRDTEADDSGAVTLAGGVAYVVQDEALHGFDLGSGTPLLSTPATDSDLGAPVVAAGHLFLSGSALRAFAP